MPAIATVSFTVQLGDPRVVARYLEIPGVLRQGHFRLLSGLHSDTFVAFSRIANASEHLNTVSGWLAPTITAWGPTAILAPPTAGVGLAATLARDIGCLLQLAELDSQGRAIRVGSRAHAGERVVVVNDIVTTGDGLRRLSDIARTGGASVVGAAWFMSRSTIDAPVEMPAAHVTNVALPSWPAEECELCRGEEPLEEALDLN